MSELTRTNETLPAFMLPEDVDAGTENLGEYIRPPRVKVVQPLSKALTDEFNVNDTVLLPQRILVAASLTNEAGKTSKSKTGAGEKWHFVPLFFWPEWIAWNPRELKDEPAIAYRTTNRDDPFVEACRDSKRWLVRHENSPADKDLYVRNCEHLNFVVMPIDSPIAGMPVCISFSRSEHRVGTNFASLIKMRKAPIFGCIFEASTGYRENADGEWYGLDVRNPSEETGGLVQDADDYKFFKHQHEELKKAHAANMIQVDLEDGGEAEVSEATDDF